jgi:hypothetical protein
MNEKQAKRLRKEVRRYMVKQWRSDLGFLQSLPLHTRIKIAFQIVFKMGSGED